MQAPTCALRGVGAGVRLLSLNRARSPASEDTKILFQSGYYLRSVLVCSWDL